MDEEIVSDGSGEITAVDPGDTSAAANGGFEVAREPSSGHVVLTNPATCEGCGVVDERYAFVGGKCGPCCKKAEDDQKAMAGNLAQATIDNLKRTG